jgi:hypothetical protein
MKTYEYADDTNNAIIVTDGDTVMTVPNDPGNRHFREILDGIAEGKVKVAKAKPRPVPEPEPDYTGELIAAISSATTIAGLKAALIGNLEGQRGRIQGGPK